MIPYQTEKYEDLEIEYYLDKPFVEIFNNRNFSKLQQQLLYILILDNYTRETKFSENNYLITEMLQFLTSEAYSNLFRSAARNGLILLTNFIVTKKLITEATISDSFVSSEQFFFDKIEYFIDDNRNIELCKYYHNLLNKNTIFAYPNIFSIFNCSKIIKYPIRIVDKRFNDFNWEHINVIKTQQLPLEIYIKHIESLSDVSLNLLEICLPKHEIDTLLLIKEMM